MNVLKKLGAFALVVMLAVCFCVAASAVPLDGTFGTDNVSDSQSPNNGAIVDETNGISNLTFGSSNTSTGAYYAGSVTYTIDDGTDMNGNGTPPDITFYGQSPEVAAGGKSITKSNNIGSGAFNYGIKLNLYATNADPGLYEFTITQTLDGFNVASGSYGTLYLDVVVKDQMVTQAVLLSSTGAATGQNSYNKKVTGFEYVSAYTPGADVTLKKVVDGTYGILNNGTFEFSVIIAHTGTPSEYHTGLPFTVTTATNGVSVTGVTAGDYTATLANNATTDETRFTVAVNTAATNFDTTAVALTISGLPEGMQVTFAETNRGGATETTATVDGNDVSENFPRNEQTNEITSWRAIATVDNENDVAVVFTNFFNEISLTGVTLRYAPYLLILGAGLVFLPMTRSYRRREDI